MSADNRFQQGQVIPFGAPSPETDTIYGASQQIENALNQGRDQLRKLRDDVMAMQARFQQATLESERKAQHATAREQQLNQSLDAHRQTTARRERTLTAEIASQRERAESLHRDLENALHQMEQIRTEARKRLEAGSQREEQNKHALSTEIASQRERAEALQRDLDGTLRQMDQLRTQARQKLEASAQREARLNAQATGLQAMQEALKTKITQLQERVGHLQASLEKSRSEVELYKSSWAQVLKIERDAKAFLQTKEQTESKIRTLEARNAELLTEAKNRIRAISAQLEKATKASAEERSRFAEAEKTVNELRQRISTLENGSAATQQTQAQPPIEIQVAELSEDFERISSARTHLETERDALKSQLAQAMAEAKELRENSNRMRRNYPLRDLLAHKEAELTSAVRELKRMDPKAPARSKAAELVEMLSEQRDQLRGILHGSDMSKS